MKPKINKTLVSSLSQLKQHSNEIMRINYKNDNAERQSVIVVMDANNKDGKGSLNMDALEWTLKNAIRSGDTVLVLGVLLETFLSESFNNTNKNNISNSNTSSCFAKFKFLTGIGFSGIWERLEFVGQDGASPGEIEEHFKEKRILFRSSLEPFSRQCKKMEVKLDVKLAAGFSAGRLTVEEAHSKKARWVILDSHFKKDKVYVFGHVNCNVALIKGKDVATLKGSTVNHLRIDDSDAANECRRREFSAPQSPCWFPLSWRSDFPRAFPRDEIRAITNGFSEDNLVRDDHDMKVYQGLVRGTPVLVKCFKESGDKSTFFSMLQILSRIRHRNIANLVGYCCTGDAFSLLFDYPCNGTVAINLQSDELAQKLGWKVRWCIAQEIGGCLRYLHQECTDGPIIHNSVYSFHVVFSHGSSAMLSNFQTAKWLKNDDPAAECVDREEDKRVCVDVRGYGLFLLELVTGKSASHFLQEGEGQTLIDWGLPLLEKGLLCRLMDSRLTESEGDGNAMAHHMAHAALHCLRFDSTQHLSITQALGIVRGDTHHTCDHLSFGKHQGDCSCNKTSEEP